MTNNTEQAAYRSVELQMELHPEYISGDIIDSEGKFSDAEIIKFVEKSAYLSAIKRAEIAEAKLAKACGHLEAEVHLKNLRVGLTKYHAQAIDNIELAQIKKELDAITAETIKKGE